MATLPTIHLHDKDFQLAIPYARLQDAIAKVAQQINADYGEKECPVFMGILNGSFMFLSELMQRIDFNCEVSFVKLASYSGMSSSGTVQDLIGLSQSLKGRHVIIVEDIVDTGVSIDHSIRMVEAQRPASVAVATLLFKPQAYTQPYKIDYCALSIPDMFIVGFGLDYNQLGRNLKDIYEFKG